VFNGRRKEKQRERNGALTPSDDAGKRLTWALLEAERSGTSASSTLATAIIDDWWRIKQFEPHSQLLAGLHYAVGYGARRDPAKAVRWLSMVEVGGNIVESAFASALKKRASQSMTPEQIQSAQSLVLDSIQAEAAVSGAVTPISRDVVRSILRAENAPRSEAESVALSEKFDEWYPPVSDGQNTVQCKRTGNPS